MQKTRLLALLAAASGITQAALPPRPCKNWPSKLAKLHACPTASAFCQDYLAPAGPSYTKTFYETKTVSTGILTKTEITDTSTTTYSFTITEPTVSTSTATVRDTERITTYKFNCRDTVPSRNKAKRAAAADNRGIRNTHSSSAISGACNCILASTTTNTITVTGEHASTTTETETHTHLFTDLQSTTTSTSTTTTTTTEMVGPTVCIVTREFYMYDTLQQKYLALAPGGYLRDSSASSQNALPFTLEYGTNYITAQDNTIANIPDNNEAVQLSQAPLDSSLYPLTCSIGNASTDYTLSCVANTINTQFYNCVSSYLILQEPGYQVPGGQQCGADTIVARPVQS